MPQRKDLLMFLCCLFGFVCAKAKYSAQCIQTVISQSPPTCNDSITHKTSGWVWDMAVSRGCQCCIPSLTSNYKLLLFLTLQVTAKPN